MHALFAKIESWRRSLAQNLALHQDLTQRELNRAVHTTIARSVFLGICAARAPRSSATLLALAQGPDISRRLSEHFPRADAAAGEPTPPLRVDDEVLKEILLGLDPANGPGELAHAPADSLGQIYEQFLGPTGRKAGGVYYTPAFIVDYIVEQTVGRALEGKTPHTLGRLAILDAACGSGAFLLGAYQSLLTFYRDGYVAEGPHQHGTGKNPRLHQTAEGQWCLTTSERERILTSHIFGVDIDPQAVEVTKLSLLLMALAAQSEPLHERALSNLARNIQCGNSLVESDGEGDSRHRAAMPRQRLSLQPFDWKRAFPAIMDRGGFDAVIGNPPYLDAEWMSAHLPEVRDYCVSRYAAASGNWDMFCVFAERAMELTAPGGLTSQLVPNKLGAASYAAGIRRVLTVDNRLLGIRDYSDVPVFRVAAYPLVYVARRSGPEPCPPAAVSYERYGKGEGGALECVEARALDYATYFRTPDAPWEIFARGGSTELVARLKTLPRLGSIATVLGAATVAEAYEIHALLEDAAAVGVAPHLRLVNSGTIDRYRDLWGIKPCRYLKAQFLRPVVPESAWGRLPAKRRQQATTPKIILAGMTKRLEGIADLEGGILAGKSTTIVVAENLDLRLLLALLNSAVVDHFYQIVFGGNKLQGGYLRIGPPQVRAIPVPKLSDAPRAKVEAVVELVDEMMRLQATRTERATSRDTGAFERKARALDSKLDQAVAALYGLTATETELLRPKNK